MTSARKKMLFVLVEIGKRVLLNLSVSYERRIVHD